ALLALAILAAALLLAGLPLPGGRIALARGLGLLLRADVVGRGALGFCALRLVVFLRGVDRDGRLDGLVQFQLLSSVLRHGVSLFDLVGETPRRLGFVWVRGGRGQRPKLLDLPAAQHLPRQAVAAGLVVELV